MPRVIGPRHYAKDDLPDVKLLDIYNWARSEWKIDLIAHGAKSSDSIWRRRYFDCTEDWDWMLYPVKDWTKFDVLAYLKTHSIPVPQQDGTHRGGAVSGVDLALPAVLWLHDHHPEDWEKFLRWFPYADALVARRDMYGIGVDRGAKGEGRSAR